MAKENNVIGENGVDDVLLGWAGNDRLHGGAGDDLFVFHDDDGLDTITDFNGGSPAT